MSEDFDRIGLVVHPRRQLERALASVRTWAERQDAELVQLSSPGQVQEVAPPGVVEDCDLVIALGGDGTTLAALRAAARVDRAVLGVACGSLGALTAVTADDVDEALDRVAAADWTPRHLPALVAERDGEPWTAINDLVLVRGGAGQVMFEVRVEGERFIRLAGDGIVAATPLGSTAYTLAAGGPMLVDGALGMVLTALSPHGGVVPPLVTGADTRVELLFESGNGGSRVELDGQVAATLEPRTTLELTLRLDPECATLVTLGHEESPIAGLRRRRILMDSPRVLARDDREAAPDGCCGPPRAPIG